MSAADAALRVATENKTLRFEASTESRWLPYLLTTAKMETHMTRFSGIGIVAGNWLRGWDSFLSATMFDPVSMDPVLE